VAENDSPRPRDRAYVSFNYFDNYFGAANRRPGADLSDLRIYREQFGVEKSCLDGNASFGLRLPLNTFQADRASGPGITHTALGDLALIGKYVLLQCPSTGR